MGKRRSKVKAICRGAYIRNPIHIENLLRYMERQSPLFNQNGWEPRSIDLAVERAIHPDNGIFWHLVFSPNYEECLRCGLYSLDPGKENFLGRDYMRALVATKKTEIAKAYGISPENLRVNASWHEKEGQPHLHLTFYSTEKSEGWVKPGPGYHRLAQGMEDQEAYETAKRKAMSDASDRIKSVFANTIFAEENLQEILDKTSIREALKSGLTQTIRAGYGVDPYITEQLKLIGQEIKGRAFYSYQDAACRQRVDDLLQYMAENEPTIKRLYHASEKAQLQLLRNYASDRKVLEKKMEEWRQGFFHPPTASQTSRKDMTAKHNIILAAAKELQATENKSQPGREAGPAPNAKKKERAKQGEGAKREKEETEGREVDFWEQDIARIEDVHEVVSGVFQGLDLSAEMQEQAGLPDVEQLRFDEWPGFLKMAENEGAETPPDPPQGLDPAALEPKWSKEYKAVRKVLYGSSQTPPDPKSAFALMRAEAYGGLNTYAMHDLGRMYLFGQGCGQDEEKAQECFSLALKSFLCAEKKPIDPDRTMSEKDLKQAEEAKVYYQYRIGKMYHRGYGTEQDYETAAQWYQRAYEGENPYAAYSLGSLYYYGQGVDQNYERALELYQYAAEHSKNGYAMYALGGMYQNGLGTAVDRKMAREWYEGAYRDFSAKAEKISDDQLEYRLGYMDMTGTGTEVDYAKAEQRFLKADFLGNTDGTFGLGKLYANVLFEKYSPELSKKYYRKAAEKGHVYAQIALAKLLLRETKNPEQTEEAIGWLEKAAETGNASALYALGNLYYSGKSVQQDLDKAESYFRLGADKDPACQCGLGLVKLEKAQTQQEIEEAISWLVRAAEEGGSMALYTLGTVYFYGKKVEKDLDKAISWFQQGADQEDLRCQYMLAKALLERAKQQTGVRAAQQDNQMAQYYLKKVAEEGDEKLAGAACYNLGKYYTEVDAREAITWFEKGASRGNTHCWHGLGKIFDAEGMYHCSERAVQAYKAGYQQGDIGCAYQYAVHLALGKGIGRDTESAKKIFEEIRDSEDPASEPYKKWAEIYLERCDRLGSYRAKSPLLAGQQMIFRLGCRMAAEQPRPDPRSTPKRKRRRKQKQQELNPFQEPEQLY